MMLNSLGEKWCFAYTSQVVFLQRISDAVQRGHGLYHAGRIQRERAVHFYNSMCGALPIFEGDNTNAQRAWKARQAGSATGKILFWLPHSQCDHLHFVVLMTSHGELPEIPGEKAKWIEVKKSPIQIAQYKLAQVDKSKVYLSPRLPVKTPKPGTKRRDTHTWTWKIADDIYQDMRNNIVHKIKSGRAEDAKELLDQIFMIYGFSEARAQAKKLIIMVKSHWSKYSKDPLPIMYTAPKYIQRLPDANKYCKIYKDGSTQKPGDAVEAYTIAPKDAAQKAKKSSGSHPLTRVLDSIPPQLRNDPSIDIGRWKDDPEYRAAVKKEYDEMQTEPVEKKKIETRPSAGDDYYKRADLEHNYGQIRLPGT
jgi:hypothetical protein